MADNDCALHLRFCPLQPGYGAQFGTGIISTGLTGGPDFTRLDTTGNVHIVSATWVLGSADYCEFMGFVRTWENSGGDPFTIDLRLDTPDARQYTATFEPGSVRLQGVNGSAHTVGATLKVMPLFLDACADECASRAVLSAVFGDELCEIIDLLDEIVLEDMNVT